MACSATAKIYQTGQQSIQKWPHFSQLIIVSISRVWSIVVVNKVQKLQNLKGAISRQSVNGVILSEISVIIGF